jgi:hypothetical protein
MRRLKRARLDPSKSFYDICGEPPLLNDDERRAYLRLRAAIEKALGPKDFFDFQAVAEIACNIVEAQRFKQAQIALIKSPAVLAELLQLVFGENVEKAKQVALHYFGRESKKMEAAAETISAAGLSASQIQGHAIVSSAEPLHALDRLVEVRQAASDRKIKELKKRQKKYAVNSKRALVLTESRQKDGGKDDKQYGPIQRRNERARITVVK